MIKKCCVCGSEFEAQRKSQVTCGSDECKRLQHLEYMRTYAQRNRAKHRAYNRAWMREYRDKEDDEPISDFDGLNYAERQKQKTLAMVGGVDIG